MTLLLKQIFNLFKLLNSDKGTNQIAAGIACGLIMGFAPALSLQTLLVFVLMFFFRIQIGAALVSAFFFAFPAYIFDPLFHIIGSKILEQESLRPLFTTLYNMPIMPFTKFYNSVVMGAGIVSLIFAIPMFFLAKMLIVKYREKVVAKFQKSKVWKAWTGTTFYKWYTSYENLYGN